MSIDSVLLDYVSSEAFVTFVTTNFTFLIYPVV